VSIVSREAGLNFGAALGPAGTSSPVTSVFTRTGDVVAANGDYSVSQVTGAAPLASPTFTGVPAAPTATVGTNTTQLATTAFVQANHGVSSVFGRTGAVTAQSGDYTVSQVTGAALLNNTLDWVNVVQQFGADPTGVSDSSTAFQNALTAIKNAGGGVLYIPAGNYLINTGLTYSSANTLYIVGDGSGVSNIRGNNSSASVTYLSVTSCNNFAMFNLSFLNNQNSPAFSDPNINVQLNSVTRGSFRNVAMQTGTANRINQGIVLSACTYIDIDDCDIRAYVNGLYITGASAVITVRASTFSTTSGSGVSSAAAILADSTLQTLHLNGLVLNGGDRGILWQGGTGANPAFGWFYDVEVNNTAVSGMDFETGAEIWMNGCWLSNLTQPGLVPGLIFGASFDGNAYLEQCTFQGWSGHSVQILGGSGYDFNGCVFGNDSKNASNTYDEINIASGVNFTTIRGCHFNTDPFYGVGATHPRSAVFITSGAGETIIEGCTAAAASNYGTAAIVDFTDNAVRKGNIGIGFPESVAGVGNTVTGTSFAALSGNPTIPIRDAQVGSTYKITAFGHGTQATGTSVNLSLRATYGGGLGAFTAGTNPGAGAAFTWSYSAYITVTATGASGSLNLFDNFQWNGVSTYHSNVTVALNSTVTNVIGLFADWASTTGTPTITCDSYLIERLPNLPLS
jgi:Pectate lyase superfamily protein